VINNTLVLYENTHMECVPSPDIHAVKELETLQFTNMSCIL